MPPLYDYDFLYSVIYDSVVIECVLGFLSRSQVKFYFMGFRHLGEQNYNTSVKPSIPLFFHFNFFLQYIITVRKF